MSRSFAFRRRTRWCALVASTIALSFITWTLLPTPRTTDAVRAGASSLSTCLPSELQVAVVFNGPGNPSGAIVLNTNANQTCVLSGQPNLKVFNLSNRLPKLSESKFQFTPALPSPVAPILLTPSAPWAVVEMKWCGFSSSYSRIRLRFHGWQHSIFIRADTIAPKSFTPPACSGKDKNQLAVDFVRKLTAKGITGRSPTVEVHPSIDLRNGEKVKVTVSGFGLDSKFFLSECASASDVNSGGCGQQLALQPFGLTDMIGTGSYEFYVTKTAAAKTNQSLPSYSCSDTCVLVVTGGFGASVSFIRIRFG